MNKIDEVRDQIATCQAAIDQATAHFQANIHMFTEEQAETMRGALRVNQDRLLIAKMYMDALKK